MMQVEVTYYGLIAELLGKSSEVVTLPKIEGQIDLQAFFNELYPQLENKQYQVAVNQEITPSIELGKTINEIAILPPFAGG